MIVTPAITRAAEPQVALLNLRRLGERIAVVSARSRSLPLRVRRHTGRARRSGRAAAPAGRRSHRDRRRMSGCGRSCAPAPAWGAATRSTCECQGLRSAGLAREDERVEDVGEEDEHRSAEDERRDRDPDVQRLQVGGVGRRPGAACPMRPSANSGPKVELKAMNIDQKWIFASALVELEARSSSAPSSRSRRRTRRSARP